MRSSGGASARASSLVAIMAKAPVPGRAKTRLAAALSPERTAALQRAFLADTIALATTIAEADVAILCPQGDGRSLAACAPPAGVEIVEQRGKGLAVALAEAFERFTARGYARVVALDSDSPHLPPSFLRRAIDSLADSDLVVGPTRDGGYYLVGARAAHPRLFDGDHLGTRSALEALLARARDLRLTTWLADEWYDVDRPDDLAELSAALRADPRAAPATASLLGRWDTADAGR